MRRWVLVLVLVGGLVGGLFGREGGGCRGVGGRGGLWGVLGASGGGRKGQGSDLVMEFPPYATTTSTKPRRATKSKAQADFCGFRSTRAAIESVSCHSRIRRGEIWVSNHHEAQFRMPVSRTTLLKPRSDFCAERPAVMQGSLRALTAHSTAARCSIQSHPHRRSWLRTT